jgi:hypothetical protein
MGPTVDAVASAFDSFVGDGPSEKSVRTTGIDYPAYHVPMTTGATHGVSDYVEGAFKGVLELLWTLRAEQNRCAASGETIVLVGYSQGSWVIHSALAYAAASGTVNLSTISGVGLIADPQRLSHAPETNIGSASDRSYGIANVAALGSPIYGISDWLASSVSPEVREYRLSSPTMSVLVTYQDLPGTTRNVTAALCDYKDPVCAVGDMLAPALEMAVHSSYGPDLNRLAQHLADMQ